MLSTAEHAAGAKQWAEDAAQSLDALTASFGKLEVSHYGLAEMHIKNRTKSYNYEADGFSVYDGVLFDGRAPDVTKIAHEVAHSWFGGAVDATGPGERFLTEGLAEYAAWLAVEARSGSEAAREAAKKGLERYQASPGDEHALGATDFSSPRYAAVAYAKGAFAMRTLRSWLGPDALADALREYLAGARTRAGSATLDDLLEVLRAKNATVADEWAQDWLRRPGAPRYSVVLSGTNSGTLVQTGDVYRNPVELELTLVGGAKQILVVTPASLETKWSIAEGARIESVVIDPQVLVLFPRTR